MSTMQHNATSGSSSRMYGMNRSVGLWSLLIAAAAFFSGTVQADTFGNVYYDPKTDELVVTMVWRGTNPDHNFSVKWGECQTDESNSMPSMTAEVLDDQWKDVERDTYEKTTRFGLSKLPCTRPVSITLRTAPRFYYTVTIP
jgi:hypothetical protein